MNKEELLQLYPTCPICQEELIVNSDIPSKHNDIVCSKYNSRLDVTYSHWHAQCFYGPGPCDNIAYIRTSHPDSHLYINIKFDYSYQLERVELREKKDSYCVASKPFRTSSLKEFLEQAIQPDFIDNFLLL